MFTNYLPSEMVTVLEVTTMFSFLVGTILVMLFTSDQANKKNLYLKKAKWLKIQMRRIHQRIEFDWALASNFFFEKLKMKIMTGIWVRPPTNYFYFWIGNLEDNKSLKIFKHKFF